MKLFARFMRKRKSPSAPRVHRVMHTHPQDLPLADELAKFHAKMNVELFGGQLSSIAIRVSRRMRSRLGHYAPAQRGAPPEIAISRRHIAKHGLDQALSTLLHEMVHQWQDESKLPLDHGAEFRRKAREVGVIDRASRRID